MGDGVIRNLALEYELGLRAKNERSIWSKKFRPTVQLEPHPQGENIDTSTGRVVRHIVRIVGPEAISIIHFVNGRGLRSSRGDVVDVERGRWCQARGNR